MNIEQAHKKRLDLEAQIADMVERDGGWTKKSVDLKLELGGIKEFIAGYEACAAEVAEQNHTPVDSAQVYRDTRDHLEEMRKALVRRVPADVSEEQADEMLAENVELIANIARHEGFLEGYDYSPHFDSRPATWEHIHTVQSFLMHVIADLQGRMLEHDLSKLQTPELEMFDEFTQKLEHTTYDSEEYRADVEKMKKSALGHHYKMNDHHPEHFLGLSEFPSNTEIDFLDDGPRSRYMQGSLIIGQTGKNPGIHGMNLIQMLEMLTDWKAATFRHADGDLDSSITKNAERFGYGQEIENLLRYTAAYLGWL